MGLLPSPELIFYCVLLSQMGMVLLRWQYNQQKTRLERGDVAWGACVTSAARPLLGYQWMEAVVMLSPRFLSVSDCTVQAPSMCEALCNESSGDWRRLTEGTFTLARKKSSCVHIDFPQQWENWGVPWSSGLQRETVARTLTAAFSWKSRCHQPLLSHS